MGSRAASTLIATWSPTRSRFLKASAHARATYTIPAPSWAPDLLAHLALDRRVPHLG
jgi:hypothetical protein